MATYQAPAKPEQRPELLDNESVEGRLGNMYSGDSPLKKLALTTAKQAMGKRGFEGGSSLYAGEAVKQLLKFGQPIAAQDAGALQGERAQILGGDITSRQLGESAGYASDLQTQTDEAAGGRLGKTIASNEGMLGTQISADTATATQLQKDQKEIIRLNAEIAEAVAAGNFEREKELKTMLGTTEERMATAGNETTVEVAEKGITSQETMQDKAIKATTDLTNLEADLAEALAAGNQTRALELQKQIDDAKAVINAANITSAEKMNAAGILSNELISGNQITSTEGMNALGIASSELIHGNQVVSDEAMAAARIISTELLAGNQIDSTELMEAARIVSSEFISQNQLDTQVSESALDRESREALNDAAISGDMDRLTTQITATTDAATAELASKLAILGVQGANQVIHDAGVAASALGTLFQQAIADIQRDPNILEENKGAAIRSATDVYRANIKTMMSVYGGEINFDVDLSAIDVDPDEIATARTEARDAIDKIPTGASMPPGSLAFETKKIEDAFAAKWGESL